MVADGSGKAEGEREEAMNGNDELTASDAKELIQRFGKRQEPERGWLGKVIKDVREEVAAWPATENEVKLPPLEDIYGMGAIPVGDALAQRNDQLRGALAQIAALTKENTAIKEGKGWFEDTPSGTRRHYFCSDEEELKQASIQIAALTAQVAILNEQADSLTNLRMAYAEAVIAKDRAESELAAPTEQMEEWKRKGCEVAAVLVNLGIHIHDLGLRNDGEMGQWKYRNERAKKAEAELATAKELLAAINPNFSAEAWLRLMHRANVAEADLAALREGETVTYRVETLSGRPVHDEIEFSTKDAAERYIHKRLHADMVRIVEVITRERILDTTGEKP
jgi:multidrug efflux pump subunit AcrA (membrane-fusion protein)